MANNVNESLTHITGSIETINDMNTNVASSAEEQTAVTDEINKNVDSSFSEATQTLESAEKIKI